MKKNTFLLSQYVFTINPVDSWGDEGVWKTAIDFSKIAKPQSVTKLLKRLDKIRRLDK